MSIAERWDSARVSGRIRLLEAHGVEEKEFCDHPIWAGKPYDKLPEWVRKKLEAPVNRA